MTLREKLAAAIAFQQQEIARIDADAIAAKTEAQRRLTILRGAEAALTPDVETLIAALHGIGVKVLD